MRCVHACVQEARKEAAPREEERQRGAVARGMYLTYVRAWGPALVLPAAFLLVTIFGKSLEVRAPQAPALLLYIASTN